MVGQLLTIWFETAPVGGLSFCLLDWIFTFFFSVEFLHCAPGSTMGRQALGMGQASAP